jgi:hypothetical protein
MVSLLRRLLKSKGSSLDAPRLGNFCPRTPLSRNYRSFALLRLRVIQPITTLPNLSQAILQPLNIRTDLRLHGVLQCERAFARKLCGGLFVQILLPVPDGLLGNPLGLRRCFMIRRYAGLGL